MDEALLAFSANPPWVYKGPTFFVSSADNRSTISAPTPQMALFPRALAQDLRSAFRMLEEPFFSPTSSALAPRYAGSLLSNSPFFNSPSFANAPRFSTPVSSLREEGDNYLLEAEMPGVKKSDIKVEFREHGQVLEISGHRGVRASSSSSAPSTTSAVGEAATDTASAAPSTADKTTESEAVKQANSNPTDVVQTDASGAEVTQVPSWAAESYNTFHSVYRFPRAVDVSKVQATHEDGVLRLTIPKLEKDATRHTIEVQ